MSDQQDGPIRERAYAIWQSEGSPDGRHDQHWRQAAAEIAQARDEAAQHGEPVLDAAVAAPVPAPAPAPTRRGRKAADPAVTPPEPALKAPAKPPAKPMPKPRRRKDA